MMKTYKYRIYPTKSQVTKLNQTLEECRWVYNHFLEQRKSSWENDKTGMSYYSQLNTLPGLKKQKSDLKNVHSQVLQNVAMRVDLAYQAFFRRCKSGETPGYPRFKGKGRYSSITYPQSGYKLVNNNLKVSKIGNIKIKLHRELPSHISTCTIQKTSTDKWFVCFTLEAPKNPLSPSDSEVGIDFGISSYIAFSDGPEITNPKFFKHGERRLAKSQRKKSKKTTQFIHEKIQNKRNNFIHQESRKIVNKYGTICIEDLSINSMTHNHCLAKSILDASWGQFTQCLSYKAEEAGRRLIKVNPAYTSQTCSACGHRKTELMLSDRIFECECCGLSLNRDHNAAINILTLGTQCQVKKPKSPSP